MQSKAAQDARCITLPQYPSQTWYSTSKEPLPSSSVILLRAIDAVVRAPQGQFPQPAKKAGVLEVPRARYQPVGHGGHEGVEVTGGMGKEEQITGPIQACIQQKQGPELGARRGGRAAVQGSWGLVAVAQRRVGPQCQWHRFLGRPPSLSATQRALGFSRCGAVSEFFFSAQGGSVTAKAVISLSVCMVHVRMYALQPFSDFSSMCVAV
jgi:hypothetical protein